MDQMLCDQLAILSYVVYINFNPYALDALVWGSVDLLEKFMDWHNS